MEMSRGYIFQKGLHLFDYYHAWKPLCSHLGATKIYCIIPLESHHYK